MSENQKTEITILNNGPVLIKGDFVLKDAKGGIFKLNRDTISLCRCGQSNNKPFCDGKHKEVGFQSIVEAK